VASFGEAPLDRAQPLGNAGLAGVDLLPVADQAHHHRPGGVAVEAGDQELRFREVEARLPALALHKARRLLAVPRALGLIEDGHVVDGRRGVRQPRITKVVDALDEALHLPARLADAQRTAVLFLAALAVPR